MVRICRSQALETQDLNALLFRICDCAYPRFVSLCPDSERGPLPVAVAGGRGVLPEFAGLEFEVLAFPVEFAVEEVEAMWKLMEY